MGFSDNNPTKTSNITIGMLAHVDAGKTTLTESLLFNCGAIRKLGRVDHRDSFLDTDPIERQRGITVYSKQARLKIGEYNVTLLDTPGHADLCSETERALWVLDYAVLLISAQEGVNTQVRHLWIMLKQYGVPTLIFVNKTDRPETDKKAILEQIQSDVPGNSCVDFSDTDSSEFAEAAALCDEELLERFLNDGKINDEDISELIKKRKIFPVFFGSALKNDGITEFIGAMEKYLKPSEYKSEFAARAYKVTRDRKGTRLVWMKITGGSITVKQNITYKKKDTVYTEKIDQIRIYSGTSFEAVQSAKAGDICAVAGLEKAGAGDVLGEEEIPKLHLTQPILTYEVEFDDTANTAEVLEDFRKLEEEEPELHVSYSDKTSKISVRIMGKVRMEVLKETFKERFGINIRFGSQTIIYKETVSRKTEGAGHFEPLRHYAEVRLTIEPLEAGSGIQFDNICPREELEPHWQRLILSHLNEKIHTGVLTDSELTDVRITLTGGRAHTKHTEPGDFRQAVFRAIRQGLMENTCILLEPYYEFIITLPEANLGRAMFDLNRMGAENASYETENSISIIKGKAPASEIGNYQEELTVYTSGKGRIQYSFGGYEPCHNSDEIIEKVGYDPDRDIDNPSSSVFCSHGAGIIVPWYNVKERMHTVSSFETDETEDITNDAEITYPKKERSAENIDFKEKNRRIAAAEEELKEIFAKTYGSKGESASRPGWKKARRQKELFESAPKPVHKKNPGKEYLLVDGYNIIFAWDELKALAQKDLHAARDKLVDILCDYHGTREGTLILVFDAYKVSGGQEKVLKHNNIYIVYTKESETADQYIEKTVHDIGKNNYVAVATSDGLEQIIILAEGAVRISAAGLWEDVQSRKKQLREEYLTERPKGYLLEDVICRQED